MKNPYTHLTTINKKLSNWYYLKSNKDINFSLDFIRIEPYARSKQQLSGDSRELVDTRVIEVIYKIEGNSDNIYIGQQVDVFIEAKED